MELVTRRKSVALAPVVVPGEMIERPINVLILASSLWIGGAETVIRHLALTIDRRRFNVTVCHLKQRGHIGDQIAAAGADIIGLPPPPAGKIDYFTFLKLRKIIADRKIDVVHTHTTHGLLDACLCKSLSPRLRVIHTFHFGNYPHTQPRLIWIERIFSRVADRIYAVGDAQKVQLQKVFGFSADQIGRIWNGVTKPQGEGDPDISVRARAQHRPLIGTIATFIEQKGLFDLLAVARKVKDRGHDVSFAVVGEGHLRPQLEARRRELGLDDTVFLTGWLTNAADVALPRFDIFFQPSLWEAMSVVVIEAMRAGKPLVVTHVGENPRVVDDGVDGLVVPPGNVDAMADALCKLLDEPSLAKKLGDAASAKAQRQFSVEQMTHAYEQVYLDVLR
jgi:glycosyltransferase involved in cell wall biosynthesis